MNMKTRKIQHEHSTVIFKTTLIQTRLVFS